MIPTLLHAVSGGFFSLAQLKSTALEADPSSLPASSSIMTMVMGAIIVIGVIAIAFRPAKRDHVDK